NPKTQESEVQHLAFLQNRILYQDQFCLFLRPIRILHGRLSSTTTNQNRVRNAQAAPPDGGRVRSLCDLDTLETSYRYDAVHFNNTTGRAGITTLMKPGIVSFIQSG
ncbi:hypothetical protein, partial [Bradyrhizobium sp. NAS80.1]|uniref:hypothetical protein n=1 Tax=Bradyrhizobium sp. NAS80.1 TaxID=1680159 RepID=UPI001AEFD87B